MTIRTASVADTEVLAALDRHISREELAALAERGRVFIAWENDRPVGWLRYNLFWDNTPFMNMLYLMDDCRGKGYGRALVEHWESCMKQQGYSTVMTSTASDEYAQHFYNHLGYSTIGGFTPPGESYELILAKTI